MIELFPKGLEMGGDVRVIHQPAELRITFAGHRDFHAKAVAVQAAAFVRFGQMRQQVRGFELKRFAKFHFHRSNARRQTTDRGGRAKAGGRVFSAIIVIASAGCHSPFPVGPGHQIPQARPAIVAPRQRRVLHLAERADARDAPARQLPGDLVRAFLRSGQADG